MASYLVKPISLKMDHPQSSKDYIDRERSKAQDGLKLIRLLFSKLASYENEFIQKSLDGTESQQILRAKMETVEALYTSFFKHSLYFGNIWLEFE